MQLNLIVIVLLSTVLWFASLIKAAQERRSSLISNHQGIRTDQSPINLKHNPQLNVTDLGTRLESITKMHLQSKLIVTEKYKYGKFHTRMEYPPDLSRNQTTENYLKNTNTKTTINPKQKNSPAFYFNSDFAQIQLSDRNVEFGNTVRDFDSISQMTAEPAMRVDKNTHGTRGKRALRNLKGDKLKGKSTKQLKSTSFGRHSFFEQTSTIDDILIDDENNDSGSSRYRRAVTAKKERIWDHGVIPYEIDTIFSAAHKALFVQAMHHWENFTCIKFVERDPREHINYIYFTVKNCGCCSFVGKRGNGRQAISIGHNCEKFGIVVHELGHVIGFWHEHTRIDRDNHIIINKGNIMKGQEYNFDMLAPEDVDSLGLPYDFNSIMHYAKNTFSKSVYLDTIQPIRDLTPVERGEIGQRVHLSKGDIAQANLLYNCPKCGRTFQENAGKIFAPHYFYNGSRSNGSESDSSSGDLERSEFDKSLAVCEWRIIATNGERIILQVHELNLMETADCATDFFEVRDGYWYRSPKIVRLCGNLTAQTIKSESSRMLISYSNHNALIGYKGFIADFEVICGGDIFLTKDRRIDSPNYPVEYLPDKECIWRISVAEKYQIALKFQSFELENDDHCMNDFVEIRDGNSSDSELIGVFCGYKLPPNIKTTSNEMYVRFVSDGSVQKIGFSAIFLPEMDECKYTNHGCQHECINTLGSYECACYAGYELQTDGKACEDACGGIIDASIGNATITSPSYPDVYPISKQCVWELVAPMKYAVFLNFTEFDLEGAKYQYSECNYDYLIAYSKLRDGRLKKIGVYCGKEIPTVLNSEQNILRLEFYSDKSVQHKGFSANYYLDKNECSNNNGGCQHQCKNTFGSYVCSCRNGYTLDENRHNCTETKCKFEVTNSNGIISSPNYPNDYPRNIYCFWHFHTFLGHRVQLTFHDFEMENHQECIYDYVSIHDGKSENSSTLGVYCGGREPYAVLASSNDMFMVLKTDAGLQRKGFMAMYSTECGGYMRATNRTQTFYSHPRFGRRPYRHNMYCNWRIQSDPDSSVKLKFIHFQIEYSEDCDYDSLEITEDSTFANTPYHGRYCGDKKPPTIISYSDTILIRFQTDESTSLRGFVASFIAVEPPDEELVEDTNNVTPFPGYMKSMYVKKSELFDDEDVYNDDNSNYDDDDNNDDDDNDDGGNDNNDDNESSNDNDNENENVKQNQFGWN